MRPFPFSAVVGQDRLKTALLLNAVDPRVGGVLVRGQKGTAKSTAVRALAALLPPVEVVAGCPYACDPAAPDPACPAGPHGDGEARVRDPRLVELPLGATEDRLVGSLDLEQALAAGQRAFEPGLLARAHRGVLYVDEVNLLSDHLVDLLLDAAAMGRNFVEREGVSVSHAARFLLVGTMNPEEGELRPQLLDRFGLSVQVAAPTDPGARSEVVRRRLAHDADPGRFAGRFAPDEEDIARRIRDARERLDGVVLPDGWLTRIAEVCAALEVDGLRADIVASRAAVARAAWEGRGRVAREDVRTACLLALPHRRRRGPFEEPGLDEDELDRLLDEGPDPDPGGGDPRSSPSRDRGGDRGGADGDGGREPARAGAPREHGPAGGRPGGPGGGQDREEAHGAPDHSEAREQDSGAGGPEGPPRPGRGGSADRLQPVGASFVPPLLTTTGTGGGARGRRSPARGRHGATVGTRRPAPGRHHPVGDLALSATLRAAAPHQRSRQAPGEGGVLQVRPADLRLRVREGREGNLVVFVLDTSGSMGARRRMTAVKGAVRSLLLDAYQRRDRVALVVFRGGGAHVALPPTSSAEVADRRLADLPTGGRTPLAAGLGRACELVAVEATRDPDRRPLLVLVTDGRATAGDRPVAAAHRAAERVAARSLPAVVIDSEDGFVRLGLAARLAARMGAVCLRLDELAAGPLARTVRVVTGRAA